MDKFIQISACILMGLSFLVIAFAMQFAVMEDKEEEDKDKDIKINK